MTFETAQANMAKQIKEAQAKFKAKAAGVHGGIFKAVTKGCLMIEGTVKEKMTNTELNMAISYKRGKNKVHHPSMEGSAPAVDSGTLRRSITHSVEEVNGKIIGKTGSTITKPPYLKFLENGTSKMKPHPVLLPSVDENRNKVNDLFIDVVSGRTVDVEVTV